MTRRAYVLLLFLVLGVAAVLYMRGPSQSMWQRASVGIIDDYVATHEVRLLQIGAGEGALDGWLNTDIDWTRGHAYLDCTEPFPLPDNSFRAVFSEQVIEHIPYEDGLFMLKESFRILEPGGHVRVNTPDLRVIIALFADDLTTEQKWYIENKLAWHGWPRGPYPPTMILNFLEHDFGHQYLFDEVTLVDAMEQAGFVDIKRFEVSESDVPELANVEYRTEGPAARVNAIETMILQGRKPR